MSYAVVASILIAILSGCGGTHPATGSGVDEHNAVRAKVSMPALTWSDDLARQAQSWADRCDFNHSSGSTGENLYANSQLDSDPATAISKAVASWAAEADSYDASSNSCARGQMCGHYTQLVWSTTTSVGCAIANCPDGMRDFTAGTIVVCEYYPAGNYVGVSPFGRARIEK